MIPAAFSYQRPASVDEACVIVGLEGRQPVAEVVALGGDGFMLQVLHAMLETHPAARS